MGSTHLIIAFLLFYTAHRVNATSSGWVDPVIATVCVYIGFLNLIAFFNYLP